MRGSAWVCVSLCDRKQHWHGVRMNFNAFRYNFHQETIPVWCEPPACQKDVLHNEQVWTCPEGRRAGARVHVQWGLSWTSLNMSGRWGVPVQLRPMSWWRVGCPCTVRSNVWRARAGGPCMVSSNAAWVMVTWDVPPPSPAEQTWLKILPSHNYVSGYNEHI